MATKEEPDMSGWTEEEIAKYKKYGAVPKKGDFAKKLMRGGEKPKRFDSADFEMQKKEGGNQFEKRMAGKPMGLGAKKPLPANVKAEFQAAQTAPPAEDKPAE